jgi:hypothetical protein
MGLLDRITNKKQSGNVKKVMENFIWDNKKHSVSWLYEGKRIERTINNMFFASVNEQKKNVYIEAGKQYSQEQVYILSFEGECIFECDILQDKVCWKYQNKRIKVDCKKIVDAQLYEGKIVLIICTMPNQVDKKLQGFALDGAFLFEVEQPKGYCFYYLSSLENQPSVVCDGGEDNSDGYGRSMWHFSVDIKNGDLRKESLAY